MSDDRDEALVRVVEAHNLVAAYERLVGEAVASRATLIEEAVEEGLSLSEIGDALGHISRQRVHRMSRQGTKL